MESLIKVFLLVLLCPEIKACQEDDVRQCFGIKCFDSKCDRNLFCYGKMEDFYCCYKTHKCGIQDLAVNCHDEHQNVTVSTVPYNNPSLRCSLQINYIDNNTRERKMDIENLQENQVFTHFVRPRTFTSNSHTRLLSIQGISDLTNTKFSDFQWLTSIYIQRTTLTTIIDKLFEGLQNLKSIEIVENFRLTTIHANAFVGLENLTLLNLSYNAIKDLPDGIFLGLSSLEIIDLRGQKIHVTSNFFDKNSELNFIYADSYSFCCLKPKSMSSENCVTPPKSAVTSCDDLIEDRVLQVFLWIIGIMAVVGNLAVIVYHFIGNDPSKAETYSLFVMNLSVSDAMMGIYMLIIGSQAVRFQNTYVYNEYEWRSSLFCKITGGMAYVSSESSVIFIFFITLDRLLAIKYPLGSLRITKRRAYVITIFSWIISFFTAALPGKLYKGFYSRSGVCIAIPLTGSTNEGRFYYSASVFLGVNFVVFLFIAVGQYLIFREIKLSSQRVRKSLSSREKSVAKLLLLIVVTDCLCWLPIGILVILVICGVTIPDEMYAWVVVCILPGNSAINPFLYTFAPAFLKSKRLTQRMRMIDFSSKEISITKMNFMKTTEVKTTTGTVN